jgi:inner membrane protein involved in colicin E2 resistance
LVEFTRLDPSEKVGFEHLLMVSKSTQVDQIVVSPFIFIAARLTWVREQADQLRPPERRRERHKRWLATIVATTGNRTIHVS